VLKKELGPPMNADKLFAFNPRLSEFIGGHQFRCLFSMLFSLCDRFAKALMGRNPVARLTV
jgi:hypothetical protein